jgi:hypothetical protein
MKSILSCAILNRFKKLLALYLSVFALLRSNFFKKRLSKVSTKDSRRQAAGVDFILAYRGEALRGACQNVEIFPPIGNIGKTRDKVAQQNRRD